LAEVRRLLRPLREQAEVARRHAAVVEELDRIHLVLAARELMEIRRRLGPDGALDLDAPIRSAEHEIADLDEALAAAGRERAAAAERADAAVARRREELAAAESSLAGVQSGVAPLRNAQRDAQAVTVRVRGELATLAASMEAARGERDRAGERRQTLDAARER